MIIAQKSEPGYGKDHTLQINREGIEHYKAILELAKTRYQIIDTVEQEDGSVVHVRKQYNDKADVPEYFE